MSPLVGESSLQAVSQYFARAANTYDSKAAVQKLVAQSFSQWLLTELPYNPKTVLELGCGTGVFTEELLTIFPTSSIFASDAAQEMLDVANIRFSGLQDRLFLGRLDLLNGLLNGGLALDGKLSQEPVVKPTLEKRYGLIVSSFVLQWFPSLEKILSSLLNAAGPDGCLAFAVPINGSFPEWHSACQRAGVPFTANALPEVAALEEIARRAGATLKLKSTPFTIDYDSPLAFFQSLKYTGASCQTNGKSVGSMAFRELIQSWHTYNQDSARNGGHTNSCPVTWHVLFALLKQSV